MAKKLALHVVGDLASTSPQPPRPLGVHGQSLWNRIQSEYAVSDSGGVELLAQACEGLDLAGRLREQINADGEVIRVRGIPKAHPAVRDLLQAQAFVTRTLARLGLDVEPLRSGPGRPPTPGAW